MPYHQCPGCDVTSYSAAAYSTPRVCPLCSTELTDASRLYRTDPAVTRGLMATDRAPAEARALVASLGLPWYSQETLKLVACELVSNSLKHAGLSEADWIDLVVVTDEDRVWVSVHDEGPGFDPGAPLADGSEGFGLSIVAGRSAAWGVDCETGCTVWCAIAVETASRVREREPALEKAFTS
jgi:anti-sigma regulatory factor (Ser/Thr protein kinase)